MRCDICIEKKNVKEKITTHTSRVRCDVRAWFPWRFHIYFYSHIPCGMWHQPFISRFLIFCISTHTSRVGCDTFDKRRAFGLSNFYSHIPCGMWQSLYALFCFCKNFYSHIPCGMWPKRAESERIIMIFLLTHPVWDVTEMLRQLGLEQKYFYSHIPCGMWRYCFFNILSTCSNFYSHIPCGMWPSWAYIHFDLQDFYSHIPCGMWHC